MKNTAIEKLLLHQMGAFTKKFHFKNGKILSFTIHNRSSDFTEALLRLKLIDPTNQKPYLLKIWLKDVSEYRFQRRPTEKKFRIGEIQLGYYQNVFYLNLDAYPSGEAPLLIDFRASDAFLGAESIEYSVTIPKPKDPT